MDSYIVNEPLFLGVSMIEKPMGVEFRRYFADAVQARAAAHGAMRGPVSLCIHARLPRPKSMGDSADLAHVKLPSVLRIARYAVQAAKARGVVTESQLTNVCLFKSYVPFGAAPYVTISFTANAEHEQ